MQLLPDKTYHIYTHANGSENLFRGEDNYRYFLKKYAAHVYPVVETYAYCLMPNHLHLAVRIRNEKEVLENLRELKGKPTLQGFETLGGFSKAISLQFSHMFNGYTQAYNNMYGRRGSLFIPNFKRKLVENDQYLTDLILYIHHNPVHHGFVKNVLDWPHSSIHAYLFDRPSKLNRQYLLEWVGNKEQLMRLHEQWDCTKDLLEF